jgi:putative tryptophan/tyrosine transport system substrate-binding protein
MLAPDVSAGGGGGYMERVRRELLLGAGALLAAPFAARAQQPAKVPRIGFLSLDLAGNPRGADGFRAGLRDLGYVEGRNIVVEYADAHGNFDRFPALAAGLVEQRVDIIVAPSILGARAAQQATKTIPIVFAGLTDPVADGLVASLARPGGNVTGLSNLSPELTGKRLELLKQAVPKVSRIAILWQPGGSGERASHTEMLLRAATAGATLRVQSVAIDVRGPADFERAFAEVRRERADALTVVGSPMFFVERGQLLDLAARSRLPGIYPSRQYVDSGGLMSYGASLADLLKRSVGYVDRILKGARPADLPVEQPTKFELVVSLKAAKALGLVLPPSVLDRADEVIAV